MSEILRGGRLFAEPARAVDILIDGGRIQAVAAAGTLDGDTIIDLDGLLLMPGAIDTHVHPIHDETFASVGRAAVFGGVTTICNQLYPAAGEGFAAAIDRMAAEGAGGAADFAAHVRWDRTRDAAEVLEGADAGAVSIKVFLAHPDKSIQATLGELVTAMTAARDAGLVTLVHAELGDVVDALLASGQAKRETLAELNAWRSTANEAAAVTAASVIARTVDAPLYVVHASCDDTLVAAAAARAAGTDVSIESCPHYAFLNIDTALPGGQGFVLPPVRPASDQAAVRRALVNGLIDTMGSDHCGHGHESKRESIADSKAGLPGLEAMIPLLIDAALGDNPWLPRHRVEELVCSGPARIFGLEGKGALLPGYDADIVAIDPNGTTTLRADQLHDAAGYSPYDGWQLRGSVERVWRRGELVVNAGIAQQSTGGRLVRRAKGNI